MQGWVCTYTVGTVRFGHPWRRGRERRREKREGLEQSWVLGSIKSVAGVQQITNYKSAAPTSTVSLHFLKLNGRDLPSEETSQWDGWVWVMYRRRWLCKQVEMGAGDEPVPCWAPPQERELGLERGHCFAIKRSAERSYFPRWHTPACAMVLQTLLIFALTDGKLRHGARG